MFWIFLWLIGIPISYAFVYIFLNERITVGSFIWPIFLPTFLLIIGIVAFSEIIEEAFKKFDVYLNKYKNEK